MIVKPNRKKAEAIEEPLKIPAPELKELSADWLPWTHQVNLFGNAAYYGHRENRVIRTGMHNFESREAAESFFRSQ